MSLYVSFTRVEIGSTVEEPETLTLPEIDSSDELDESLALLDESLALLDESLALLDESSSPPHAAATKVKLSKIGKIRDMRLLIRTVFLLL